MADQFSSFLGSPRFFNGFKNQSDIEASSLSSPTSVLDTKNPSSNLLLNPFACDRNLSKSITEPKPIGLAIIDSINNEKPDLSLNSLNFSKPVNRMALFGSKLKIQIPNLGHDESAKVMTLEEMELFEDYTCVIIHGPNPKTTHIFDNCIVESCTEFAVGHKKMECGFGFESVDFLSFCHTCKDTLGQGRDIYMYRLVSENLSF